MQMKISLCLNVHVALEFQSNGGVVINITATLSVRGTVLQTHAGTAKAAIGNIPYIYYRK